MLGNMAPFNRGLSEVTVDNPNDTTHTSSHTHPSHPSHRMRPPPPFNGDRGRTDMDGTGGPEDDLNEGNVRVKPLSELPVGGEGIGAISPGPGLSVSQRQDKERQRHDHLSILDGCVCVCVVWMCVCSMAQDWCGCR